MVLATRTSALNTSLAVIRPKPRPDSPTASEISVIMLKSELLHEAPNPVSKKAARVHRATRGRGGCLADCGTRSAIRADAAHRRAYEPSRGRSTRSDSPRGIPEKPARIGLERRRQCMDRPPVGREYRRS